MEKQIFTAELIKGGYSKDEIATVLDAIAFIPKNRQLYETINNLVSAKSQLTEIRSNLADMVGPFTKPTPPPEAKVRKPRGPNKPKAIPPGPAPMTPSKGNDSDNQEKIDL